MEQIFVIALLAVLLGALAVVVQPRYVFLIRIQHGRAQVQRGKVASHFVDDITAACFEMGIARGWVGGVQHGPRVSLAFCRAIPPPCQQRLRNIWALHAR